MIIAVKISALCLSLSPTLFFSPPSLWVGVAEAHPVTERHMSHSRSNRSPHRGENEERPRQFDAKAKSICWANADTVPGRHPERWRKDAAGNVVCKRFFNCLGCLCFEYDHIVPYSKGGESVAENCQILQSRVNRYKSNQEYLDKDRLEGYSCDVKFSGTSSLWRICVCSHVRRSHLDYWISSLGIQSSDKELDIIEMAVYGDVVRPGKECRCRTVAETLGKFKPKDNKEACKLP